MRFNNISGAFGKRALQLKQKQANGVFGEHALQDTE
jgi:hypothetical protein